MKWGKEISSLKWVLWDYSFIHKVKIINNTEYYVWNCIFSKFVSGLVKEGKLFSFGSICHCFSYLKVL